MESIQSTYDDASFLEWCDSIFGDNGQRASLEQGVSFMSLLRWKSANGRWMPQLNKWSIEWWELEPRKWEKQVDSNWFRAAREFQTGLYTEFLLGISSPQQHLPWLMMMPTTMANGFCLFFKKPAKLMISFCFHLNGFRWMWIVQWSSLSARECVRCDLGDCIPRKSD